MAKDRQDGPSASSSSPPVVGALTAGGRSLVYQFTSFYLRSPLKLFRPARFDYLYHLRVLPRTKRSAGYWNNSSIGVLWQALGKYGWKIVPDRLVPPILANSLTGIVLYTTYLSALKSDQSIGDVAKAGFVAGTAQAIVSTPIDAIYTRSSTDEILLSYKNHDSLWIYGYNKLKEIGLAGCFGGFSLTLFKESAGFAVYFTAFELIKTHLYNLVSKKYRQDKTPFMFLGGVTAAFLLQVVQYPLSRIQKIHLSRLEAFDIYNTHAIQSRHKKQPIHVYYNSYLDTFDHLRFLRKSTSSGLTKFLYTGFTRNTLAILPGTTAGLLLLEYMKNQLEEEH